MLENLAFDGRGGMLLSRQGITQLGSLDRLTPDGNVQTLASDIDAPGGIAVQGRTAYVTVGNSPTAAVLGTRDGTVDSVNLDTGARHTVATGLTMPNGLAILPDGNLVVSRNTGQAGLSLIRTTDPSPIPYAVQGPTTNGLALDHTGRWLYTDTSFDSTTQLLAIDTHNPSSPPRSWAIPGAGPLNIADDLTADDAGNVYVALNLAGEVVRVDTISDATCVVARGLVGISSVRIGDGTGWDPTALYTTGFDGTVHRLDRPVGR
ncbi:hypothetical protein [Nocardia salmonicida]|uniref:hypothetical protein n=1 Tax=Nocardia salmonicida TaxID=53431 RepID=UPI002E2BE240|nr:hypothetical protein [Nocardia salmonicida]